MAKLLGPRGSLPLLRRVQDKLHEPAFYNGLTRDADERRRLCTYSPILFALYYLPHHVKLPNDEGGQVHALSEFHVAMATAAKRWIRQDLGPKEVRDAWIAPRESGKSTWIFLILALWALAYGHRRYIVVYSDTDRQGRRHLKTLRAELRDNDRLRRDFPQLCEPLREGGHNVMDNADGYLSVCGAQIEVISMGSATLGAKWRQHRPDALFCDDIQSKEGDYGILEKEKRLTDLVEAIFPCNIRAVVQIVGTTVMHGCIMHDLMLRKPWTVAQNIKVHHFRALIEDPETGEERSCWPTKWPTSFLLNERLTDPRGYAKNFDNEPVSPDGTYWDDADITHDASAVLLVDERVLVVDPAAKSKKTSDETGIGMAGHIDTYETTVVERVMGVRLKPVELRELVLRLARDNDIGTVLVDVTNGGEHVLGTFEPLPLGVRLVPVQINYGGKADRFARLLARYQKRRVVHARVIPGLESQMKAWRPRTKLLDDRIDAVALADEYFRDEIPGLKKRKRAA